MLIIDIFSVFIASILLIYGYRLLALRLGLIDIPNHRSAHSIPVPSGAGFIFASIWLVAAFILPYFQLSHWQHLYVIVPGASLIILISFADDIKNISIFMRLVVQAIAVGFTFYAMEGVVITWSAASGYHLPFYLEWLAFLGVMWSINLYNFMDGIDGLAGMQALFIFGIGGLLLIRGGAYGLGGASMLLMASVSGFLFWNLSSRKVFMGDCGSAFLGFVAAMFALIADKWYHVSVILWILLYSAFIFDATMTLVRRMIAGEKWYLPHNKHAFQRLLQLGWTHREVVLFYALINSFIVLLTLWVVGHPDLYLFALILVFLFLTGLYLLLERFQPMFPKERLKFRN